MTTDQGAGMYVDTASGQVFLPDGVPDWVTQNIIDQAGGLIEQLVPPTDNTPTPQFTPQGAPESATGPNISSSGQYVQTMNGPVYIPDGTPDWLVGNLIEQNGGLAFGADPPKSTQAPPPSPPPATPPPTAPRPPSPVPVPVAAPTPTPGRPGTATLAPLPTLSDIAKAAQDTAGRIAGAAMNAAGTAYNDVTGLLDAIKNGARDAISQLIPTVSELALGLTQRFGDLASFIGGHLMEAKDFAENLAGSIGSGMSIVFEDAWHWLVDSLTWLSSLLLQPLQQQLDTWFADVQVSSL